VSSLVCGLPLCLGCSELVSVEAGCADDGLRAMVELAGGGGWLLWRPIYGEMKKRTGISGFSQAGGWFRRMGCWVYRVVMGRAIEAK